MKMGKALGILSCGHFVDMDVFRSAYLEYVLVLDFKDEFRKKCSSIAHSTGQVELFQ